MFLPNYTGVMLHIGRGRDKIGASLKESDITNSKPATPKKIAPSPTKPKQAWTVQVASFAQEKDAESLARKLTQKGYDVYIIAAEVGGKTQHRVQIGELTSRQKAFELQQTLKASEKLDQAFIANR